MFALADQPSPRPSYLEEVGWYRSRKERRPIDAEGNPLPWYTYPAIAFLRGRIKPSWRVFEYGSGYSTLWWASRVAAVVSCEHNADWHAKIAPQVPANVTALHRDPEAGYAVEILSHQPFDVVVVDGEDRLACGRRALQRLTAGGVIIWDNSEIRRYQLFFESFYRSRGWRWIDFNGQGPQREVGWTTTILYREGNCLGI